MRIKYYIFYIILAITSLPAWSQNISRHSLSMEDMMAVLDMQAYRYDIDIGKEKSDKFSYFIKCEKWHNGKIVDFFDVPALGFNKNGKDSLIILYPQYQKNQFLVKGENSGNVHRYAFNYPLKLVGASMWVFNDLIKPDLLAKKQEVILAIRTDALGQGKADDFDDVDEAFTYFNKIKSPDGELIVFRLLLKSLTAPDK